MLRALSSRAVVAASTMDVDAEVASLAKSSSDLALRTHPDNDVDHSPKWTFNGLVPSATKVQRSPSARVGGRSATTPRRSTARDDTTLPLPLAFALVAHSADAMSAAVAMGASQASAATQVAVASARRVSVSMSGRAMSTDESGLLSARGRCAWTRRHVFCVCVYMCARCLGCPLWSLRLSSFSPTAGNKE